MGFFGWLAPCVFRFYPTASDASAVHFIGFPQVLRPRLATCILGIRQLDGCQLDG